MKYIVRVTISFCIVSAALNWYFFIQTENASPFPFISNEFNYFQLSGIISGLVTATTSKGAIIGPLEEEEEGDVPSRNISIQEDESIRTTIDTSSTTSTISTSGNIFVVPSSMSTSTSTVITSANGGISTRHDSNYNPQEYQRRLQETLIPLPNSKVNTTNHIRSFMAGLCNQYQRFIGTILLAHKKGYGQIIEESITWKDTFGTNFFIQTHKLWDVVHWNSFYPTLPRFARYEQNIHTDLAILTITKKMDEGGDVYEWNETIYNVSKNHDIWKNVTYPPPLGEHPNQGEVQYRKLMRDIDYGHALKSHPEEYEIYKTILNGALRPHPVLQGIIDKTAARLGGGGGDSNSSKKGYMVIHARLEPDMARQQMCNDKKVYFMDNITDMIYRQYPEPPVETVLLVFARALLEKMEDRAQEKRARRNHHDKVNKHNLDLINNLLENGMWGGKVKVIEAGSELVENEGDPFYKRFSNIAGGIVNFFLAVQSKILIGTEVSTFSTLSMNTRFFRDERENYFYRPDGLHWVTPPNSHKPHRFMC